MFIKDRVDLDLFFACGYITFFLLHINTHVTDT